MNYCIFSFTEKGHLLADRIQGLITKDIAFVKIERMSSKAELEQNKSYISSCQAVIFVGAVGIAVRFMAPFVNDKLTDPAVICIDELGQFVIPILSGHIGGANELADYFSKKLGAVPVITTATDVNNVIAIDEFAKANELQIVNRDNIKRVSNGLLKGVPKNIALSDDVVICSDVNEIDDEVLGLVYRPLVVGMGLRRGKALEELESFFLSTLDELGVSISMVCAIASIDVKKDEKGLIALAEKYKLPLYFYSAKELSLVEGSFEESDFVKDTVGVSDVSGRAAKAAGKRGKFILEKKKNNGMTISVFEKLRRVTFEY